MGLREDVFGTPMRKPVAAPSTRSEHFFHGTTSDLSRETHLKPSAETGHENYDYDAFSDGRQRKRSVFMTTPTTVGVEHRTARGGVRIDEELERPEAAEARAWDWATSGAHNRSVAGRPVVYRVHPEGKVSNDVAIRGAKMASRARILGSIDIPPARGAFYPRDLNARQDEAGHVQGTLAPVNWNQFHRLQDPLDREQAEDEAADEEKRQQRVSSMFDKPKGWINPGLDQGRLF